MVTFPITNKSCFGRDNRNTVGKTIFHTSYTTIPGIHLVAYISEDVVTNVLEKGNNCQSILRVRKMYSYYKGIN